MNWNEVAAEITRREGLKKQVTIAQVKEVIGILADMYFDAPTVFTHGLQRLGDRRNLARTMKQRRRK